VVDEAGRVADNTRNQDLSGGEFHVAPDFVFMLVTDVARFGHIHLIMKNVPPGVPST
jgi:hypothetical protein